MIKKIEYQDSGGVNKSYSIEIGSSILLNDPTVTIDFLDEESYITDPDNGFIDANGNPTEKIVNIIKSIEKNNASTWEFNIANITRFDNRGIRDGKSTVIKTEYDAFGNYSDLITGIGDLEDCKLVRIDTETEPEIMSKALFISTMSGFTVGFSSGVTNDVIYAQLLNPVNANNVNNYYPILNHGYFYNGISEYYLYGNKQTEIINPKSAITDVISGFTIYNISGLPNYRSPIIANFVTENYLDIISNISISDYSAFSNNSYRVRYDVLGDGSHDYKDVEHNLVADNVFVYIATDTGEIIVPQVEVKSKNEIVVLTPYSEVHGYINIIRPNEKIRIFNIDVNASSIEISHGLNSSNLLIFGLNADSELSFIAASILDSATVYIPQMSYSGKLIIFDISNYSDNFYYASFSSGTVNHNLNLYTTNDDIYVDPWVFGVTPGLIEDNYIVGTTNIVDENNVTVDFHTTINDVTIYVIDFWRLNAFDAYTQTSFNINTDNFAFNEKTFYGNEGVASPFHKVYPLHNYEINNVKTTEYRLKSQPYYSSPRPLDFLSSYYDTPSGQTDDICYISSTNQLLVPNEISGVPILIYEKDKSFANEFRFRGTDISPVSWYNTDRVVAIQINELDIGKIEIFPDKNEVKLTNSPTRPFTWGTSSQELMNYPYNVVEGSPITYTKATIFVEDEAGTSKPNIIVNVNTRRRLYKRQTNNSIAEYERIYNYTVEVIDNTNDMFALPVDTINTISGQLGSLPTIRTQSIFDKITFSVLPVGYDIFDDDGYLFTVIEDQYEYLVPFVGALFVNDSFTHNTFTDTNVFGSTTVTIGFHNTTRTDKVKSLYITAYPSGEVEGVTNLIDTKEILVYPISSDDLLGYIDSYNIPNLQTEIIPLPSGNVFVIEDIVPTISTSRLYDTLTYIEASGSIGRTGVGGIDEIYDFESSYGVILDHNYESTVPSGVPSGYVLYSSGSLLRYDTIDFNASIFNRGEFYG